MLHERREWDAHWFTLADPEGNEFCVVAASADEVSESTRASVTPH